MNQKKQPEPLVADVPEAGAMAGLSRVRAYAAAKDGSMPTIRVAGRLKVPLKAWRAKLNGENQDGRMRYRLVWMPPDD